ncbi:MAG TPA: hypothetical protein VD836_00885 [Solirubrobacteraceae bacterium]|nr:hypothetical protein [Solirubrobacteraceae bacterium]
MPGRYESHYVRAVDPDRPRGAWIRHTTFQRPGGPPAPSFWCTVWDADAGPPAVAKVTAPLPDAVFGPSGGVGGGTIAVRASVPGRAAWDLRVEPAAAPLRHLPHPRLYAAPLPRTKLESPAPMARVSGTVSAGDRALALDGWPGMAGHNWGSQHAETWLWLHGIGFDGAPGAWLDLAVGRVRIGGRTTPWIANGALELDGRRQALGGLRAGVLVDARPAEATVRLRTTVVRVTAPPGQSVAWVYADPPGGEHHSINCSIARIEIEHDGRMLSSPHGGVYELGTRDRGHGIPVAPFPDP